MRAQPLSSDNWGMVAVAVAAFLVSWLLGIYLVRYATSHAKRYEGKVQRFHAGSVPRVGGVALAGGCLAGAAVSAFAPQTYTFFDPQLFLKMLVVVTPVFLIGLVEDVTQRVSVRHRLALSLASGLLAVWLLDLTVPRLGLGPIDTFWQAWPWLGIGLAFLAVAGAPHAFNLIDGYNGLAGVVAAAVCAAFAHIALQLGDRHLAAICVAMVAATCGFLAWNYPRGVLFAGDCGAYLWGILIALLGIQLVTSHREVSPFFPMLLVMYPVWETLFSVYRKAARGQKPGVADALHFHQLVYRRIVRGVFHDDVTRRMLARNNRTSPYLWGFFMLTVVPAVLFWRNSWVLAGFCVVFAVSYVVAYVMIIRFKVPKWLKGQK
jgi:UDP-GlcNAc:undecaprenyl-phosphate/decaprenyl-phosphate GlcNAc-1-phosphate transferase